MASAPTSTPEAPPPPPQQTLPLIRLAEAPLDPPPQFAALRRDNPVTPVGIWDGTGRAWLVTRWEDARALLRNPALSAEMGRPGFPLTRPGVPPPPYGFFQGHDDPVHTTFRKALTREFTMRRIEAMREPTVRITDRLLTAMISQGGPADFVTALALPLPSLVICELLGVPYADHDFFQQHSSVLVDFRSTGAEIVAARAALGDYLERLVDVRRREPRGDLLSTLGEHVEAGTFSLRDAADLGAFLLFAGHETTANMIGLSVLALLAHPDQIGRIHDPAAAPTAVEELLRYLTIVQSGLRRIAVEDITVGGELIRAGDGVIISLNAANRDGDAFADPDRLDLQRADARRHVAFGYGVHQCLGQPLARLELTIVLPAVFRRLPGLAVDLSEVVFKDTAFAYGPRAMPVTW
ncbi:cytochrome P450 [Pseudonocardia sp. GCM10023141]|uniref:cytochrome P450 n=1 Tax=Pseudonocardia sp. GCM10023141 TaxID=3252653 RepID=UPI00361C48E6